MLDLKKIAESALDSAFGGEDGRQLLFDLERHDRSYHPGGYEEGDVCKFRETLAKGDDADSSLAGGAGTEVAPGVVVEVCDITRQNVDAIVNAANRWMLGGGGVDGAIHRAAGPSLVAECAKYPPDANGYRVQTGEAKITGAGNLPAKWVVHTAGPDCREVTDMDEQDNLLADSYRNSLELAAKNGAKSIALPSISTGIFGFPLERAAAIAADEITDFRKKHPDVTVKMCLFDPNPAEANRISNAYVEAFKDVAGETAQDAKDTHGAKGEGWYGFDLDGTLAKYTTWKGIDHIGSAIRPMVDTIKKLHDEGKEVRIVTARVSPEGESDPEEARSYIADWCKKNLGFVPEITHEKDQKMLSLYDDRVKQVVPNKGILVEDLKTAQDADDAQQPSPQTVNLQKHDVRFHPKGYKKGDRCKYREALEKGDDADMLQNAEGLELWEGYKAWHQKIAGNKAYTLQDVADLLKDPASLSHGDARAYLQGYQELYEEEMGAGAAAKSLSALASKVKGNGPTAALLQKRLSAVKNANAAKTPGVKTPEEMRDAVAKAYVDAAMAFAKSIGANISAPQAPKGSAAAAPSAAPTPTPSAQSAPQQPQPVPAPQAKPSPKQYGPRPALSNDEAGFPSDADFDFDNYGQTTSGYRSAGSGSTNPHSIIVNGTKYYVKQAGNNPSYTNDAAENEVNANKFLRMAGLNAPESKLYTHNGINYCVTKAADTAKGEVLSNLNDPKVRAQLAEAYPVMDLMYNTDILTNGDNAFLDKNGDVVFIDNGSSFGRSAQGTRNSVAKFGFDYDKRNDPNSPDLAQSFGALRRHASQGGWKTAVPFNQIFEEAAKWNLGDLVRDAIADGLVPKQAQSALQQFADSLDKASDRDYPNVRPAKQAASQPAPAPAPSTPASATTSAPPTAAAPAPASATSPAPALIAASLSSSSNPVAQNISTLFNSFMGHMHGTPFFTNTNGATFTPNSKGGGTLTYPQGFTLSNSNAMRGVFNTLATPLGLSITRPKGSNSIQFSPMTAKQKAAAQALVTANASLPGSTTVGSMKFAPNIPAAIKNAIAPLVQGNTAAHSVGFVNGNSGAVVLSLDGRPTAYRNAVFPPVPGYKTAFNGYGIVFIPTTPRSQQNSAGAAAQAVPASPAPTPAPSAPATPQQPPAQPAAQPAAQQPAASQAPWQKRLQTIQSNTKNQALGSAYSSVANWLNNNQVQ